MKQEKCPICGGELGKVLLTIKAPDRFESAVGIKAKGYKRKWVECGACGTAVDIRGYTDAKLKTLETAYYSVDFKNSSISEKYKKIMALPPKKSDNAQRVLRIHAFMNEWDSHFSIKKKSKLRVLDIGAGTGVFLARFLEQDTQKRWKAVAVESDPLACKHLRSLKLFTVVEETYPGKTLLQNMNLCTLNKVVEHIANPVSFLKEIRDTLSKQNGVLYLELPDKMTISYRPSSDNILGSLHHHLYGPQSILCLLHKSGLAPIQVIRFLEPSGKITVAAFATLPEVQQNIFNRLKS